MVDNSRTIFSRCNGAREYSENISTEKNFLFTVYTTCYLVYMVHSPIHQYWSNSTIYTMYISIHYYSCPHTYGYMHAHTLLSQMTLVMALHIWMYAWVYGYIEHNRNIKLWQHSCEETVKSPSPSGFGLSLGAYASLAIHLSKPAAGLGVEL